MSEAVDRGDDLDTSTPAATEAPVVETPAAETPVTETTAAETPAAETPAAAATPATDERERDENGRFVPANRHKEILENERLKRESVERQLAEANGRLAQQQVSKTVQQAQAEISALRAEKAKAILDGDSDKIVQLEEKIDGIRDQISDARNSEKVNRAKYEAQESVRIDAEVSRLEGLYPALNEHSEDYDQVVVDIVVGLQHTLMRSEGLSDSAALAKAATQYFSRASTTAKPAAAETKGLGAAAAAAATPAAGKKDDRAAAAAAKNIDAAMRTPPDTKDVGLDSDKAGMKDGLMQPQNVEDLKAIPLATLKRMRGDLA